MKKSIFVLVFFLLCFFYQTELSARETSEEKLVRIEMKDGSEFMGTLVGETEAEVVIRTEKLVLMTIKKDGIKSMKEIPPEHIVRGEYWAPNPQSGRHFWSPTGYGLKAGEGYYQNLWVLFNQVSYGISDNFTIGVGIIPLFLFGVEVSYTPIWITPKFSVPLKKELINLGGGAIIANIPGDFGIFGIAYGLTTFGDRDRNLSIGLGWGFADGEFAEHPMINISWMIRTGKRGYLVSENYFFSAGNENVLILSLGGRTLWNRFSLDYGLFRPFSKYWPSEFIAFPWLGFVIPF